MNVVRILRLALLVNFLFGASLLLAQEKKPAAEVPAATKVPDQDALFKKFEDTLSGAKLVGSFTISGKEGPARKEEYVITKVTKLPQGDYWLFTARIKYGDNDVTLPMPLEVKWAGDTPVITLSDVALPGLGTFSSRVLIYDNKYVGTWTHGEVGGLMFGDISKAKSE